MEYTIYTKLNMEGPLTTVTNNPTTHPADLTCGELAESAESVAAPSQFCSLRFNFFILPRPPRVAGILPARTEGVSPSAFALPQFCSLRFDFYILPRNPQPADLARLESGAAPPSPNAVIPTGAPQGRSGGIYYNSFPHSNLAYPAKIVGYL